MRWVGVIALVAACYSPSFPTGAPCDVMHPCPSALVCAQSGTCERPDALDAKPGAIDAEIDAPPDACVASMEICDDGIDQDCNGSDVSCAANDEADGAVDVSAGGTFAGDFAAAGNSLAENGCGGAAGVDVFFKVSLSAPEVVYLDTFGSTADTTLRVFPGKACPAVTNNATAICSGDECTVKQSQLALSLPAGTTCIVVDAPSAVGSGGGGTLSLKVIRGGRDGQPLATGARTYTGDTCTATNVWSASCTAANPAKDVAWYFTACPGQTRTVDATTCTNSALTHFDTVLYIRRAAGTEVTCHDDDDGCAARTERPDKADLSRFTGQAVSGSSLSWLVLDGYEADNCGGYQLDTNLN